MNKRIVVYCLVMLLLFGMSFLSGCGSDNSNTQPPDENAVLDKNNILMPEEVMSYNYGVASYLYYRDKATNVMYFSCRYGSSQSSTATMTVMMDPETNGPLTYDNWLVYLEKAHNQGE